MSRCNECGSKECCGAHLGVEVEKLERQRGQLIAALKEARLQIVELCAVFSVPLPEDSMARYDNAIDSVEG